MTPFWITSCCIFSYTKNRKKNNNNNNKQKPISVHIREYIYRVNDISVIGWYRWILWANWHIGRALLSILFISLLDFRLPYFLKSNAVQWWTLNKSCFHRDCVCLSLDPSVVCWLMWSISADSKVWRGGMMEQICIGGGSAEPARSCVLIWDFVIQQK